MIVFYIFNETHGDIWFFGKKPVKKLDHYESKKHNNNNNNNKKIRNKWVAPACRIYYYYYRRIETRYIEDIFVPCKFVYNT